MKTKYLYINGEMWLSRITKVNYDELSTSGITDVELINMDDNHTTLTKFLKRAERKGAKHKGRSASD